jgi:hypothetical protein
MMTWAGRPTPDPRSPSQPSPKPRGSASGKLDPDLGIRYVSIAFIAMS